MGLFSIFSKICWRQGLKARDISFESDFPFRYFLCLTESNHRSIVFPRKFLTSFLWSACLLCSNAKMFNLLFKIFQLFANMDWNVGGACYYYAKHLCQILIIMVLGGRLIWGYVEQWQYAYFVLSVYNIALFFVTESMFRVRQ